MRALFLSFAFLFAVTCKLAAQNYQAVYSDRTVSFINESNEIFFIDIRQAELSGQDSLFIPFEGIQLNNEYNHYGTECFDPFGASWFGKQVVIREDGYNIFLNSEGDSVFLQTLASPGDSWIAYQKPEGITVMAELADSYVLEFLGIQDSIKTIVFQVFDEEMQPISHHLDSRHLKLSKHHGLVRSMNFSLFPDIVYGLGYEFTLMEADIVGMSHPMLGIQNLTWMQVHDFQPGDEIHVKYDATLPWFYNEHYELIHRYLERSDYADSVVYVVERQMYRIKDVAGQIEEEYIFDTISQTFALSPDFDKLPGETIIDSVFMGMPSAYANSMHLHLWEEKRVAAEDKWIQLIEDDCWGFSFIIDGCLSDHTYYKGLGGPYHACNMWGEVKRELVYYKKGDDEWGTPLVIGIEELSQNQVKVVPNPATNEVRILNLEQFPSIDFSLYDVNGRQVLWVLKHQTGTAIDLSGLKDGLYFYQIVHGGKVLYNNKLIIKR